MTRPKGCCCEESQCIDSNCSATWADCSASGLLAFQVRFGIVAQPWQCDPNEYASRTCAIQCPYGTVPCGGCSPCDPNGTAPGANGRTCPCKDETCEIPRTRATWDAVCQGGAGPKQCEIPHDDYWYLTSCTQKNPCRAEANPCCPWLGSVNCALQLIHRPAGATIQKAQVIAGSWTGQPKFNDCSGNGLNFPLPGGPLYGWPLDCQAAPPTGCPCECDCTGIWDEVDLIGNQFDQFDCTKSPVYLTAQIAWVMPCGGPPGLSSELLCGGGCDCASSYIAVDYYGTSYVYDPGVVTTTPAMSGDCTAATCNATITCTPSCCDQSFQHRVIYRRYRDAAGMPGANKCQMQKGIYTPVGYSICGNMGQVLDCNANVCQRAASLCDSVTDIVQALADRGIFSTYLEVF